MSASSAASTSRISVRSDIAEQAGRRARHQAAHRRVDAAPLGVTQQRGHAGRAGQADLDRHGRCRGAQRLKPGDDGVGSKAELADDVHAQAVRGRTGDLLVERGLQARRTQCGGGLPDNRRCRSPRCRRRAGGRSGYRRAHRQKVRPWSTSPPITSRRSDIGLAAQAGKRDRCRSASLRMRRAAIWTTGSGPLCATRWRRRPIVGLRWSAPRKNRPACLPAKISANRAISAGVGRVDLDREVDARGFRRGIGDGHGDSTDQSRYSRREIDEGFVVEPQAAVLLQHVARRLEIAAVAAARRTGRSSSICAT